MLTCRFKPDWEKAAEVPGDKLECKVGDLKERGEYQFRIVAVNKAGLSPPSDPTDMHLVKHKLRKYIFFFLLKQRQEQTLEVAQLISSFAKQ